jgi:hypothetical protein
MVAAFAFPLNTIQQQVVVAPGVLLALVLSQLVL